MTWPSYEVAPQDSVYALGVVNINYARFELTHTWMLAAVANIRERQANLISVRTNPADRMKLIEIFMGHYDWPDDVRAAIKHYLKAMDILTANRNVLVHSNAVETWGNMTAFHSMSKQGLPNLFQVATDEIRRIADDLNDYFWFGHALSNYIASEIHHAAREEGMMAIETLPILLPIPIYIDPKRRPKS
ncbi:hypothetical protein ABID58_007526 [Bradyrhizobium sp. S3.2.6]|uniref:hypothetical protein n=1 Tax=Bradyrhizobium sp. S3.2.6 TaxID=3156428 RepID=UPI0033982345